MKNTIDTFRGQYRFLSNFWPCSVVLDGETYPSVEHAYQAAKTNDSVWRRRIRTAPTPGAAKYLGKLPKIRENWYSLRLSVMRDLLYQKNYWTKQKILS